MLLLVLALQLELEQVQAGGQGVDRVRLLMLMLHCPSRLVLLLGLLLWARGCPVAGLRRRVLAGRQKWCIPASTELLLLLLLLLHGMASRVPCHCCRPQALLTP